MKGKQSKKPLNIQSLILKLAVAWALIAFVVYPNVNLLLGIFFQDGTFSSDAVEKVFKSARAMSFVYTVVLMALSSITLYFGQGNGMEKIKRWKQKRLEKKVIRQLQG